MDKHECLDMVSNAVLYWRPRERTLGWQGSWRLVLRGPPDPATGWKDVQSADVYFCPFCGEELEEIDEKTQW